MFMIKTSKQWKRIQVRNDSSPLPSSAWCHPTDHQFNFLGTFLRNIVCIGKYVHAHTHMPHAHSFSMMGFSATNYCIQCFFYFMFLIHLRRSIHEPVPHFSTGAWCSSVWMHQGLLLQSSLAGHFSLVWFVVFYH